MENNVIYISYYTGNQYYRAASESLKKSCESLGLNIHMENVKDLGAYWKNTLYKPSYILDKILEFKKDVVWIDADTQLFSAPHDLREWKSDILFASHTGELSGIKASPLGFKNNSRSIEFLKDWSGTCLNKIKSGDVDFDHDVLKYEIMQKYVGKISAEILGSSGRYIDYTDGSIIMNGISRVPDKDIQTRIVINKNPSRSSEFRKLSIKNYEL
jgi:hypothetical protein